MGEISHEKNYQGTHTCFLEKYGGLSLYNIYFETIYFIDDEDIQCVKGNISALICNPDHPDGTSTNHEYFFIHDELFDIISETDQKLDIALKVINKEESFSPIN